MAGSQEFMQTQRLASTFTRMLPDTSNLGAYRKGNIVSIQDGPPMTCTITLSGDPTQISGVAYLDSYVPVVGDTVIIGKQGGALLILGSSGARPPGSATLMLQRTADQTATTSTNLTISWDTVVKNIGGPSDWFDAGNPTLVKTPWIGAYRFTCNVCWATNASGARILRVNKTTTVTGSNHVAGAVKLSTAVDEAFQYLDVDQVLYNDTADQVWKLVVWQNTGGNLNLTTKFATPPARLTITYLGNA